MADGIRKLAEHTKDRLGEMENFTRIITITTEDVTETFEGSIKVLELTMNGVIDKSNMMGEINASTE